MKLSQLKNIGPVTERWLCEVGIRSAEELQQLGALEAFRRIRERLPDRATPVLLYALEGALRDLYWTDLPPDVRERLRGEAFRPAEAAPIRPAPVRTAVSAPGWFRRRPSEARE